MMAWRSLVALGLLPVLFCGCGGGSDVSRFQLSGKATFNGQPIPEGTITFTPTAEGGPQGFAEIKNGEFDTAKGGQGTAGGPNEVRITGHNGGKPLFNDYITSADLPKSKSTQNFEVPASAGENLIQSSDPPP